MFKAVSNIKSVTDQLGQTKGYAARISGVEAREAALNAKMDRLEHIIFSTKRVPTKTTAASAKVKGSVSKVQPVLDDEVDKLMKGDK
ncbi:MAG: hypothetical protein ACLP51_05715 [Syntrophobacteraceae bacterium]